MLHNHNSLPPCIKGNFLGRVRYCGRWHCRRHGWFVRLRRALKAIRGLVPGRDYFTCPLHFDCRLPWSVVGEIITAIIRLIRRAIPDCDVAVFVHVHGASDEGMLPIPHLHILVSLLQGQEGGLECISAVRVETSTRSLPEAKMRSWQKVKNIQAHLLYLYQATWAHKEMAADRLPKSGDNYRQVRGHL